VESFTIEVSERLETGKGGSTRCRREGFIPAVAYHKGQPPVAIKVPYKEFTLMASKARRSQVFWFQSSAPHLSGKSAIVKEVQQDFIKGRVVHVDFQTLSDNEEITLDIPVRIVGEAPGVKVQNGILTVVTHEVAVRCLPKHIPNAIEVDISALNLGQSIHASDLKLGDNVALADDEHETIVSVVASRAGEEEPKGADGAPAAAGAPSAAAAKAPAAAAKAPAAKSGK
jgi:large subunit ribosomal protein L25